ncbi:hypothetical protein BKA60DRAFT_685061 [Fusarium oxysporum]|nr:hypothetical protein BKA60DRAFT_685061 [Fusarium oxysporum]
MLDPVSEQPLLSSTTTFDGQAHLAAKGSTAQTCAPQRLPENSVRLLQFQAAPSQLLQAPSQVPWLSTNGLKMHLSSHALPDPKTFPSAPIVKACQDHLLFLHHCLSEAYPTQHYCTSATWQDVAALLYEYEFLASSILALSTQCLTVSNKVDCSVQATGLGLSAVKGLEDALSQFCRIATGANARYAAIITLTFQSPCKPDGLMEFRQLEGVSSHDAWMDAHFDQSAN